MRHVSWVVILAVAACSAPRRDSVMASPPSGAVIVATARYGTHGWPPSDPAMAASLIAFGPHISHVALGTVEMIDIAPTIARWLDVPLPTATGKPI